MKSPTALRVFLRVAVMKLYFLVLQQNPISWFCSRTDCITTSQTVRLWMQRQVLKLFLAPPFAIESTSPKPHASKPHPATWHKRKRKLRCSFRKVALQMLHCSIRFSAVRTSFLPEAALQQAKTALQHWKSCVAILSGAFLLLSCGFQAPTFRPPRLGPADKGCLVNFVPCRPV